MDADSGLIIMAKKRSSLKFLKYADTFQTYRAGDVIFREGDKGDLMYVVKAGNVDLQVLGRTVEKPTGFAGTWIRAPEKSTAYARDLYADLRTLDASLPFGFMAQPADIGAAVVYLCSDGGRYVTGQRLVVDGGMLAK